MLTAPECPRHVIIGDEIVEDLTADDHHQVQEAPFTAFRCAFQYLSVPFSAFPCVFTGFFIVCFTAFHCLSLCVSLPLSLPFLVPFSAVPCVCSLAFAVLSP